MIMVRSSNSQSFSILIPSYIMEPNIMTVHPPNTDWGRELKKAPNGGNKEAKIRIKAPIKMVNRLIIPVIVTRPTFWLKEVKGRQPKQPEMVLEKPSTAREPCNSSVLMSRSKVPVQTAVVAPVVSAADTRNTMAMVKNAPISKTGLWLVKNTIFGKLKIPTSPIVLEIPEKSIKGAIPATVKTAETAYPATKPTKILRFL